MHLNLYQSKSFTKLLCFFLFTGSTSSNGDYQPDRPIGYGAFGVVWSVTDPRNGKRVALKKLPNVFQSLVSSKRVFRELKMMRFFKHENVLSCVDILQVKRN
jgi:serine/threonine protein kinase